MTTRRLLSSLAAALMLAVWPILANAGNAGEELLDKIVEWCRAKNSIDADYTFTSGGESFAGNMIVNGNRFRVKSAIIDSWFDGTTQWTYNPTANEVSISEPTAEEIQQINPFAIIDAFRSSYDISLTDAGKSPGSRFDLIRLTPKDPNADIRRVDISVAKGACQPSRIVIKLANGETCVLTMKRFIRGNNYSDATFTYDTSLHPSAQIVDLR